MSNTITGYPEEKYRLSAALRTSLGFAVLAIICIFFSDISISTQEPWTEFKRMLVGAVTPDFFSIDTIFHALVQTVAFALIGVALGAGVGFLLAQIFHIALVRIVAVVRFPIAQSVPSTAMRGQVTFVMRSLNRRRSFLERGLRTSTSSTLCAVLAVTNS